MLQHFFKLPRVGCYHAIRLQYQGLLNDASLDEAGLLRLRFIRINYAQISSHVASPFDLSLRACTVSRELRRAARWASLEERMRRREERARLKGETIKT